MAPGTTAQGEGGRAFLQKRIALFAKVLFVIAIIGDLLQVGLVTDVELMQPWSLVQLVYTVMLAAVWWVCSRGVRSVFFSRAAEVGVLLGCTVCIGMVGSLKLPMVAARIIGETAIPGDEHYGHLLGVTLLYMVMSILLGLTFTVVVRAAIVPSRARRTAVLTALTGIPAILIMAFGAVPLEGVESLRAHIGHRFETFALVSWTIWWSFTTLVSVVISQVIFGLRREVSAAKKLGQYTLEKKLGAGGMGEVHQARHAMIRRPIALKLLAPNKAGETNIARFEREVQHTASLSHPNTVTIFDYGRTPDGVFYYVMELLDGASLDELVKIDGAQPPGRVLKIMIEVSGALEEAHGIDLIHRDIKPANIILCRQGGKPDVAKLLDFGLVKSVTGGEDAAITQADSVTGTPLYMAPEGLTSPESVDARSDLYALGAVGYFLVTGQHVFEGNTTVEVCGHHMHTEPIAPSERRGEPVPDSLSRILLACLEKEPAARPQSATELLESLHSCDGVALWTERDARAWWREHGAAVQALREPGPAVSGLETITIGLGDGRC